MKLVVLKTISAMKSKLFKTVSAMKSKPFKTVLAMKYKPFKTVSAMKSKLFKTVSAMKSVPFKVRRTDEIVNSYNDVLGSLSCQLLVKTKELNRNEKAPNSNSNSNLSRDDVLYYIISLSEEYQRFAQMQR
jgi:hypothetical protein